MGSLTTHVLDTARGRPAAGIAIDLYRVNAGERRHIRTITTDGGGRGDEPLLGPAEFAIGVFEIVYAVRDYFRAQGLPATDPPFLDEITVRIGIAADEPHHVPLLLSPFGYTVYRGS